MIRLEFIEEIREGVKRGRKNIRPYLERKSAMNVDRSKRLTESTTKVIEYHPWTWISSMVERHSDRLLAVNERLRREVDTER